ncbi:cobalt-precorrin-8X methylmutase [Myxosarcina sp. GI1]|uniref:cobalt-precorrin-8X methylmutase n=1 Tax=Myxosarcina sp. GI1 TaxID=1541065 RepID=UPI0005688FA7|nr:cobalt-precorrin-8X methylmutase [Myxosarcina sp. GI1]
MRLSKNTLNHPILEQSFAIIDREIGKHNLNPQEYAIARRVIHATADFEFLNLLKFSHGAIASGIEAISGQAPIVTDVTMVKQGIQTLVSKTFNNPIVSAIELAPTAIAGRTRTETGLLKCWQEYPQAIYIIGNAPTALLALCEQLSNLQTVPPLIIGVPVGFVSVIESKRTLAELKVPQILTTGRKGGSAVAASILNALVILATETFKG